MPSLKNKPDSAAEEDLSRNYALLRQSVNVRIDAVKIMVSAAAM